MRGRAIAAAALALIAPSAVLATACGAPERPAAQHGARAQETRADDPVAPELEGVVAALPPRREGERASPSAREAAVIDGVPVAVSFGRPSVRGRDVFGGLVPWNAVWRTGADEATAIALGGDVRVEGRPLPAGVYALFTIPAEGAWTVIFNRQAEQWGAYRYDEAQDALRVEVTPVAHPATEQLELALESDGLHIRWAELEVPVRIARSTAVTADP